VKEEGLYRHPPGGALVFGAVEHVKNVERAIMCYTVAMTSERMRGALHAKMSRDTYITLTKAYHNITEARSD
jgi:hypothetical protein